MNQGDQVIYGTWYQHEGQKVEGLGKVFSITLLSTLGSPIVSLPMMFSSHIFMCI